MVDFVNNFQGVVVEGQSWNKLSTPLAEFFVSLHFALDSCYVLVNILLLALTLETLNQKETVVYLQ